MINLKPKKLSQQNFAKYGQVIELDQDKSYLINEGHTRRYHDLAKADCSDKSGETIISIFKSQRRPFPLEIKMMEKHPLGSQAFLPMQPHAWLIVVADGNIPTPESCHAFLAAPNQAIQYHKAIWHHPLLTLVAEQDFWIIDRKGSGNNLVEHFFDNNIAQVDINPLT